MVTREGARLLSRIYGCHAGLAQPRRAPNHSRSRRRVLLYRRPLSNISSYPGVTAVDALSKLLTDAQLSGVYRPIQGADEIARAAKAAKLSIVKLDLGKLQGKRGFLARVAKAFKFPYPFGRNWDALSDYLTDLSWLDDSGWVVILFKGQDFAAKNQDDFKIAIEVLQTAAEYWRSQGKPFWVFIYGDNHWDPGLPELPGPLT